MQELGPLQQRWVNALRSGDYKQGQGNLKSQLSDDPPKYCCLGVACELFTEELNLRTTMDGVAVITTNYHGHSSFPPPQVWEHLNLHNRSGGPGQVDLGKKDVSCIAMNDIDGQSFQQIADQLEANAHLYFKEPK